jgi:hypothetical protein
MGANIKTLLIATVVVLLGGCISTGISVGPVFIPVETGIGENKDTGKPSDPPPPKPKTTDEASNDEQTTDSDGGT